MTTHVLRNPDDIAKLARFVGARSKYPLTVTITQGASRANAQNRLSHRWYADIASQRGDVTPEDVRAECKRQFGVPVLLAENEAFAASWHSVMGRLTHEAQVKAIKAFDLPVSRLMTVRQMSQFMDDMQRHWLGLGFCLTDPAALRYSEFFDEVPT